MKLSLKTFPFLMIILVVLVAGCASLAPEPTVVPTPAVTPTPEWVLEGWELVWQDEFDGPEINTDDWNIVVSGDGGR